MTTSFGGQSKAIGFCFDAPFSSRDVPSNDNQSAVRFGILGRCWDAIKILDLNTKLPSFLAIKITAFLYIESNGRQDLNIRKMALVLSSNTNINSSTKPSLSHSNKYSQVVMAMPRNSSRLFDTSSP